MPELIPILAPELIPGGFILNNIKVEFFYHLTTAQIWYLWSILSCNICKFWENVVNSVRSLEQRVGPVRTESVVLLIIS